MKKIGLFYLFFISFLFNSFAQEQFVPAPPMEGPGSPNYLHDKVVQYDFAKKQDGYYLFEPAAPRPDSANVIVFNHGYGALNPMIYGKWIEHLVRKGNIVIFPRYQKNVFTPRPKHFSKNVSQAIRDALKEMKKGKMVQPILNNFAMVGHSYGGAITADLAVNFEKHQIPKPVVAMLCSPGTGPLKGGRLDSYEEMPADVKLIVMVSNGDRTVGDKFGLKVFETAKNVVHRNFIRQYSDTSTDPPHRSGHNECYAPHKEFDNGKAKYATRRSKKVGKLNNIDFYGYWKIFDALLDCSREGENCHYAFGNTPEQRSLGFLADGTPLKELEITVPEVEVVSSPTVSSQ